MSEKKSNLALILVLGALTALSPFAIDMYLPAFAKMAEGLNTTVPQVSLSLSAYFVGLAAGQLFYGPLLDRFGRKPPLYAGLIIFILATLGCLLSKTVDSLIVFRFIQALGGCSASVAAMSMVRDNFSPKESAKILSLLVLILGVSPLLAPTVGGFMAAHFGWQSIFVALAALGFIILMLSIFFLPSHYQPDRAHSLHPVLIVKNYVTILKNPQFHTYSLAGAIGFAGLFAYLAASPIIFMEIFKTTEQTYGWIFAFLASGLIGATQLNVVLLRYFSNEAILRSGLMALVAMGAIFFVGTFNQWYGLLGTIVVIFLYLSCVGISNPNAAALALAPFSKNAGSAAALIGFLQMGIGALASVCVGVLEAQQLLPIAGIFVGTAVIALATLLLGSRQIQNKVEAASDAASVSH